MRSLLLLFIAFTFSTALSAQSFKAGPRVTAMIGSSFEFGLGFEAEYEIEVSEEITVAPQFTTNVLFGGPNAYLFGAEGRKYFDEGTYGGLVFNIGPAQVGGRWTEVLGTVGMQTEILGGTEIFGQLGYSNYSISSFFGRASAGFLNIGVGALYLFN